MKDEQIIELYFKRDERAIEETDIKYGDYCEAIAGNILWNKQDVEECVDDTYMKTWNRIPPTRPRIFKAFVGKITRELAFDMYKASKSLKRGGGVMHEILDELEECIPDSSNVEASILGNELADIIRDFVNSLEEKEAYIFTSRYFYAEEIGGIADKYGITKHNVTVILGRLREKLKKTLVKEGYLAS
ncbi:RNA polymerase sigma factor [Pseudobutyrivibrio sp.]